MICAKCQREYPDDLKACPNCPPGAGDETSDIETSYVALPTGAGADPAQASPQKAFAGRYMLQGKLGSGGFGEVYKALDEKLGETIAIKVFKDTREAAATMTERIRREIRISRRISHPSVVRIHDIGEFQGQTYISMECIDGTSLESIIKERGALPIGRAIAMARQITEALTAAHEVGVIHRDLKPSNILVKADDTVKILDFGISKLRDDKTLTEAGHILGTPTYMSPEQVSGKPVDARSDLYALGVVLYEMLTGFPPFQGDSFMATAMMHTTKTPRPPSELNPLLPLWLQQLILKLLAKDPDQRFASARDVGQALEQSEDAEVRSETLTLTAAPSSTGKKSRRPGWLAAAAGLVVVAAAAILAVVKLGAGTPPTADVMADGLITVAVFPFSGSTLDPETRSICDALAESIQANMAETPRLRVIPRLAIGDGVGNEIELLRQAPNFGIEQIVSCKANRIGSELRLNVQVVDVSTKSLFMPFPRQLPWVNALELVDSIASEFKTAYAKKVDSLSH